MSYENPQADFRITLDGLDLTSRFLPRLISLSLSEKRGTDSDQLDLVLSDADGLLAIPKAGAVLGLQLGWLRGTGVTPGLIDKGRFTVDEAEHSGSPDVLTLRARAADFTAAARIRNNRSWRDTTLGAIVAQLAGNCGLRASIAPALAGVAVAVIAQGRMSDLGMIRALGKRYDAVATVKARTLVFAPVGAGTTASGKPIPGGAITRRDGDRHSYKRAARDTYSGATAYWHDPHAARRTGVSAGDVSGDSPGKHKRLRKTYGSEADARAAAEAEHKRDQRGAVTMSFALALGRPDLYPERRVTLAGFKPEIDAQAWLIAEATHSLSDSGLTTTLGLESAL